MTVGYESDLRGISYEVWDDVTVHKGKTSDRTIHDNVRDYNKGDLIITNKRIVFIGINDNFELKVSDISATKIIDETSFIILSGSVLRNIKLDENLVIYAYGFINYVVSNYKNGVDVYSVLKKQMEEITPEQINLCRIINQEAHDIRLAELEKKRKVRMAILFSFVAVIAMLAFFSSNSTKTYDYSALELIDLPDHPRIFDKIEDATKYYRNIGDDRVAIVSIQKHSQSQKDLKNISDDPILIYFIKDSTDPRYIGRVQINIYEEELCKNMDLDKALEIIAAYLPENFLKYYKLDRAYLYERNDTVIYTYACRLIDEGINYKNNEVRQYSYYYHFKIYYY